MDAIDPPGFRIAAACTCPKGTLHVMRSGGALRIDWILGQHFVKDIRNCLQCAMPMRVEREPANVARAVEERTA
jgi:hypothetical protein